MQHRLHKFSSPRRCWRQRQPHRPLVQAVDMYNQYMIQVNLAWQVINSRSPGQELIQVKRIVTVGPFER